MLPIARVDVGAAVIGDRLVAPASLVVGHDGTLVAVGEPSAVGDVAGVERVTASDAVAVPGFVDLQVNGAAGHDFRTPDADRCRAALAALAATGTTACCPTIVTSPRAVYDPALRTVADATVAGDATAPLVLGVHLEGPFLRLERRGAHDPGSLQPPDAGWAAALVDASPVPVAIWTLAPELDGAADLVRVLRQRGVVVSAGHTDATYDEVVAAVDAGVSMVTHLFNAQRGLHHRDPGVVGAALDLAALRVGVIADGHHVHPAVVRTALRVLGERAFLVTDAIAAAGLPAGDHRSLGRAVDTSSGAPMTADGVLAGSLLTMDQAFRNVLADVGWVTAAHLTSASPASAVGRDDLGTLEAGRRADVVLLDRSSAQLTGVLCAGRWVVSPDGARPPS